jgi:hypothetical protein
VGRGCGTGQCAGGDKQLRALKLIEWLLGFKGQVRISTGLMKMRSSNRERCLVNRVLRNVTQVAPVHEDREFG